MFRIVNSVRDTVWPESGYDKRCINPVVDESVIGSRFNKNTDTNDFKSRHK